MDAIPRDPSTDSTTPEQGILSDPYLRKTISENSQIYSMFIETVCSNVNKRSDERWSKFQSNFISIISILVAVGALAGGFLINELIQVRIEKQVSTSVNSIVKRAT